LLVTRTIRHLAHSPRLRVLALLAWLFLVITPAFGVPTAMAGGMHRADHTTSSTQIIHHCDHAAPVKADRSCCGNDQCCVGHACGCGASCGSVLALPVIRGLASASASGLRWSPHTTSVPRFDFTPPLRPPAA
jgi:hypothetical protein